MCYNKAIKATLLPRTSLFALHLMFTVVLAEPSKKPIILLCWVPRVNPCLQFFAVDAISTSHVGNHLDRLLHASVCKLHMIETNSPEVREAACSAAIPNTSKGAPKSTRVRVLTPCLLGCASPCCSESTAYNVGSTCTEKMLHLTVKTTAVLYYLGSTMCNDTHIGIQFLILYPEYAFYNALLHQDTFLIVVRREALLQPSGLPISKTMQ
jgi:hypothetical protein